MTDNARIVREALENCVPATDYELFPALVALSDLETELATAKADLERAREDVKKYGVHLNECYCAGEKADFEVVFQDGHELECTCGFRAALAPEQKGHPETTQP